MVWIVAFVTAALGGLILGPIGFFLGFGGGILAGFALKSWFSGQSGAVPPSIPQGNPLNTVQPIRRTQTARTKPMLEWHASGSALNVAKLQITSGLIYSCGSSLPYPGEPSAINKTLSVASMAANPSDDMGYYPNYESISASQRRTYLEWLIDGRNDQDPSIRSLGYLFLFFYGLERRVILEKDYSPEISGEILRLLSVYGPVTRSRSLKRYFLQLAHFASWPLGVEHYRAMWPTLIEIEGEKPTDESMRLILANLHQRGEPLDWTMAYRVALVNEDCRKSVVITKSREQFWQLFQTRYQEMFPEGLILQASKQASTEQYTPASAALLFNSARHSEMALKIPNVLGLHRQFAFLPVLWNSCIDDLSGFTRAASSTRKGGDVKAWNALPAELRTIETHPLYPAFYDLVTNSPSEEGYYFVQTSALADILGMAERAKLNAAQSQEISGLLKSFGFGIAPDYQFTGIPLAWNQEVVIFSSQEVPEEQLPGLISLLFLAMALAAADGFIDTEELAHFNHLVEPEVKMASTWVHLKATEEVLRRDSNIATRSLAQVAKRIAPSRREFVLKALIHIAAADGEVGLDELKALRKIARAFELEENLPERLLREDDAFGEVTVATKEGERVSGEKIPKSAKPEAFKLDADRIKALTLETHEVISLLSVAMADEEEAVPSSQAETPPNIKTAMPDWTNGLDVRYHAAFLEIIRHDTVASDVFEGIAKKNHLMSDDLVNAINSWSDETLGDFLLERDEDVRVFRNLLPETEFLQAA